MTCSGARRCGVARGVVRRRNVGRCGAMRGGALRRGALRGDVPRSGAERSGANLTLLYADNIKAAVVTVLTWAEATDTDELTGAFQYILKN